MFNPLKQLNHFFQLATDRKLSGSDQLMYLHIFNKFNAAHWTETLRIKDAELKDLMRLYDTNGKPSSIDVIRRGRQRLKSKGFIDFTSGTGYEPEYRMPCLYPADTPANTPADSSENSYIRVREDVKDVKTKNKGERTRELSDVWLDEMHRPLGASERYELVDLEEIYGYDKVKSAIEQTKKSRYYPTFDDVKKLLKGGEKVEIASPSYTKPKRTGNEPWANY